MARKRIQKLTIKDIAVLCNLSTQTISRVINNRPDVSPETREKVENMIRELGYRPSALARSLVQQRSFTLGVIIAGLRFTGVSQTLNGITEQCEALGYALLIKELPRFDTNNIVPVIEFLMEHQVEGIIFAAPELNENVKIVQSQLPKSCPPIIFLKSQPNPNYTTISVDNYGGARKAVEYLLSIGRRHIGFISGPLEWLEARQRMQGWEDALKSVGIEVRPYKWAQGNWSSASGESSFAELCQNYPDMNGLFVSNDQMALGALHYTNAHGIQVPEQIAIIGFDDFTDAAYFSPALSTVSHPLPLLGSQAVKILVEQIEEVGPSLAIRNVTLSTSLILRSTTPTVS